MCTEVYRHQFNATGGNLFGQLTTSGSVVIQVILGPGKRCTRTRTSFEQDSGYMKRVERFVKDGYMLCHIGEWRSHHLGSNKPSIEEELYIKRIFPKGMSKFLVIIANMKPPDTVVLSPYFFTDGGMRYEIAECVILKSDNPFSTQNKILKEIDVGAEGKQQQRNENYPGEVSMESSHNAGSNSQQNDSDTLPSPRNTGLSTWYDNVSPNPQVTPTDGLTKSFVGQPNPPTGHSAAQATYNPPGNGTFQDQTANDENEKATEKEVVMKNTYDELEKYFGKGKVEIERTRFNDITMIFEHDSYHWMLRFPETFPNQPAQLLRSVTCRHLSNSSPCSDYLLVTPLTSHVNILLSIKKTCRSSCTICKSITREKLAKPVAAVIPNNAKVGDVVKGLTTDIQMTLTPTPLSFAGKAQSDGSYRIEFEHNIAKWSIEIPPEFPDKPAEVYQQVSRFGTPEKKTIKDFSSSRLKEKPLISSDLIMSAIRSNCSCSKCFKLHWTGSRAYSNLYFVLCITAF